MHANSKEISFNPTLPFKRLTFMLPLRNFLTFNPTLVPFRMSGQRGGYPFLVALFFSASPRNSSSDDQTHDLINVRIRVEKTMQASGDSDLYRVRVS